MRRLLLASLLVALPSCAEDTPTITQPQGQESPAGEPAASDQVEVTAVEYKFHGVPESLAEGEYTFTLTNEGEEPHELYLFYITSDQPVEELLELPEDEVTKVTQAVDRVEAKPGGSDELTAGLVPGRFGYVCFVESPEGPPHAFLGMAGEFAVA